MTNKLDEFLKIGDELYDDCQDERINRRYWIAKAQRILRGHRRFKEDINLASMAAPMSELTVTLMELDMKLSQEINKILED